MTQFAWGMLSGGVVGAGVIGMIYLCHYLDLVCEIAQLRQWGVKHYNPGTLNKNKKVNS